MERRIFLQRFGVGATAVMLPGILGACGRVAKRIITHPSTRTAGSSLVTSVVNGLPVAQWIVDENARPGTFDWVIDGKRQSQKIPIEGFADHVSVIEGEQLTLFVNTKAQTYRIEVYRMGYYGGLGGRLVERTMDLAGFSQPASVFTPGINMVSCPWRASHVFSVTKSWLPGNYLILLSASSGGKHHIPFTVRDDTSHAAIAIQNSVTTWQAYNLWGGYSLYGGIPVDGQDDYDSRSRVVSFDRPYQNPDVGGSGDWLGNEFPFLYFAERHGLDVTYLTNVDVDAHPELLLHHRVLVSLGHDEYWSHAMRYGVQGAALKGLNVAFLGANACYRQIRFATSPLGERRQVICYKDYEADPVYKTMPMLATGVSWATTPDQKPESYFVGAMYQNYGASGDVVVYDPSAFIFDGMKLQRGATVPKMLGSEFDAFEPQICPSNVQILAHSPTKGIAGYSDMTYYTTPHGGGIFDSGTADFVTAMWDGEQVLDNHLSFGVTKAAEPLGKITMNLLRVFAKGPAALTHPSHANWHEIYSDNGPVNLGTDVP
jgi:hypothetical protein